MLHKCTHGYKEVVGVIEATLCEEKGEEVDYGAVHGWVTVDKRELGVKRRPFSVH